MSITLNFWDLWKQEKLSVEPRSLLHHLKPEGVGSPYVESLTGYMARLAESHSVPVGVLITRELAAHVNKLYVTRGATRGLHELFNRAHALNGTGSMARDWVEVLEKLTLHNDLQVLTLLSCAEIFPSLGLLRERRAWCPTCYKQWRTSGLVVYEPLVWTIEIVKVCPYHHLPLCFDCPHCHQQLPVLEWRSRPGYCSNCGGWLGFSSENVPSRGEALSRDEGARQVWVTNTLGELIAVVSCLSSPLRGENVTKAIRVAVDLVTDGNIAAFASLVGIPKNTVWMWHTGKALPQLDFLLRICYRLEISLLEFLTPEKLVVQPLKLSLQKSPHTGHSKRVSPKPFDADRVEKALLTTLMSNEQPPPTMQEVAFRLG